MSKKLLLAYFHFFGNFRVRAEYADNAVADSAADSAELDTIFNEAAKKAENYRETFRDLLAIETKSFESYEKDGSLDESSEVESNFFVYQSSKDSKTSSELRNVIKS